MSGRDDFPEIQFLQVGRVINTVGTYRESYQTPATKPFTRPQP